MPPLESYPKRFQEKIYNSGECWIWKASLGKDGYAMYWWDGQTAGAHRYAWEFVNGLIPDKLQIDHTCKTRCCVNPAHMELTTSYENSKRGRSFTHLSERTHCPKGHPFSGSNLIIETKANGSTSRRCRTCKSILRRETRERYKLLRHAH